MQPITFRIVFLLSLLVCQNVLAETNTVVRVINAGTLSYEGALNKAGYEEFKAKFTPEIRQLILKSEGGDAASSLKIAALIHQHKLSVVVRDYCLSSCFNYLFLAGAEKSLLPDSLLGYHGFPSLEPEKVKLTLSMNKAVDWTQMALDEVDQISLAGNLFLSSQGIQEDFPAKMQQRLMQAFPRQANKPRIISITLDGKTYRHEDDDKFTKWAVDLVQRHLSKRKSQGKTGMGEYSYHVENPYAAQIYFPSKSELESLGVSGIRDYSYPENSAEFQLTMSKLKKRHGLEKIDIAGTSQDWVTPRDANAR